MKQTFIYIILCCLYVSCTQDYQSRDQAPASKIISSLIDVTDPRLFWPKPDQVLHYFNCVGNPTAEYTFRLKAISDKRLNPLMTFHLADAVTTDKRNGQHDPQNRNRNIAAFYTTVRKAMDDFYSHNDTNHSMQYSECYRAIRDELILLAGDTIKHKTLLVFSDLMEKSDVLNSYLDDLADPKKIAGHLDSIYPSLPSLKGITVIIVFYPRDRKEDKAFNSMAEAYKILLQKKGAVVTVQANL